MKIVVIGGTGLIGSKTVAILRQRGHEVVAASPNTGVNTITGEGLEAALAGAQVVIDLANSPSFEDKAVLEFFEASERHLLPAEASAGVRHHVALSIVAIDRTDNGYFRAKLAEEKLIVASGVPYTIVRATQFMEFLRGIADSGAEGNVVRLPAGPVPANRSGRRRRDRRRDSVGAAAKRRRRDRRSGTCAVQRNRRPLPESGGRPARGRARSRGSIGAARSRSARSCRWAKRGSAASVSTSRSAAHRPPPAGSLWRNNAKIHREIRRYYHWCGRFRVSRDKNAK
jgi:uncharacterized protein YbjT (DUF2867 family)